MSGRLPAFSVATISVHAASCLTVDPGARAPDCRGRSDGAARLSPHPEATPRCPQRSRHRCRAGSIPAPGGSLSCVPPRDRVPRHPGRAVCAGTCQCLLESLADHGPSHLARGSRSPDARDRVAPAKWPRPLTTTLPSRAGIGKRLADTLGNISQMLIRAGQGGGSHARRPACRHGRG